MKGSRVYDLQRKIVFISRDFHFDEEAIVQKMELFDTDDY